MTPIDDPRPFADVLREWISRHGGSAYAGAKVLQKPERTVGRWLAGGPVADERAMRALMTLADEDRA